jgi:hypothetical protein
LVIGAWDFFGAWNLGFGASAGRVEISACAFEETFLIKRPFFGA